MIGVCNRFNDLDWSIHQWQFIFLHFGIAHFWSRGLPAEYRNAKRSYKLPIGVNTAADLPDLPLVVLTSADGKFVKGNESLVTFKHPKEAIYLFGGDQEHLTVEKDFGCREPDHLVYIPCNNRVMYSFVAAGIVFYDRMVKCQSNL